MRGLTEEEAERAIAQADVKRMLAYSSVAHAGFILTAVTAASAEGVSAALFYLVAYATMIVGAFGVVMLVSVRGEERTALTSYSGLARRSPSSAASGATRSTRSRAASTRGSVVRVASLTRATAAGSGAQCRRR